MESVGIGFVELQVTFVGRDEVITISEELQVIRGIPQRQHTGGQPKPYNRFGSSQYHPTPATAQHTAPCPNPPAFVHILPFPALTFLGCRSDLQRYGTHAVLPASWKVPPATGINSRS